MFIYMSKLNDKDILLSLDKLGSTICNNQEGNKYNLWFFAGKYQEEAECELMFSFLKC